MQIFKFNTHGGVYVLTATHWDYRYARGKVIYLFDKLGQTTNANVELSNVTVGENGNIDSLLASLSYEVESELALA